MRLDEWMQAEGVDDQALADKIGVDRVTVSRIRRRVNKPSWAVIDRLTIATRGHVTADDFMAVVPVKNGD